MSLTSPRARSTRAARTVGAAILMTVAGVSSLGARPTIVDPPAPRPTTPPVSHPSASGVTFTYMVSSTSTDKRRREATDVTAMVRMQDGNIRMDYTAGKSPTGQKGSYVVINGATKQFMIVSPEDKSVLVMDGATFGSGMGAMLNSPMLKLAISNVSFRFKDLGAGEPMLGYQTRKVRLYNTSTVEVKVLGMTRRTTTSDSSDQWIAQGLDLDQSSYEAWGRSFAAGVKGSNPELAAELERYQKEYARTGMALRTVTWSTMTDEKNKSTTDSVTMQVTDIKKGAVDPSLFRIPDGYAVTNVGEAVTAMKASADSAKKADAAAGKDSAKAAPKKESAGDAIKSGLGGLLKKKGGG